MEPDHGWKFSVLETVNPCLSGGLLWHMVEHDLFEPDSRERPGRVKAELHLVLLCNAIFQ